ncbi:MAG TPA: hypothetical protein VIV82_07885 [Verrucomicrobiae bacterium]
MNQPLTLSQVFLALLLLVLLAFILMPMMPKRDPHPTIARAPASGAVTNSDHNLNPLAIQFLNARRVPDSRSPGVGTDLVYRDPWGNPYMITMDLNGDGRCRDPFYRMRNVSRDHGAAGFNNITNCDDSLGQSDAFEYLGGVMVWSRGPDGKADRLKPANVSPNKDNVLDWVR